jgi:hypothetical protein
MKDHPVPGGLTDRHPTFAEVALLIAPHNTPLWLPAFLEWWAQGIRHDWWADQYRLTALQTAARLSEVLDAANIFERNFGDPNIRNLLEAAKPASRIGLPIAVFRDIANRAEITLSSPILIGCDGKTKRGHGKPSVPDMFNAKTLLAARILELGRFLNKFEPGIKSTNAARAAQAYWLASGGSSTSFGNPLNGWKHHFKLAKDNAGSPGLKRMTWWRDLVQCQQRGRPPWCLGTYFPVPEAEIRPASGG